MDNVFATGEETKWEHQISKEKKLIATTKRLYLVNSDNTRIAVIFRKAITGCEYQLSSYIWAGIVIVIFGIFIAFALSSFDATVASLSFLVMSFLGLGLMYKAEVLTINLSGGNSIKLTRAKYFAFNFEQQLHTRVKDIVALEDI